jgi:hypothetical protein
MISSFIFRGSGCAVHTYTPGYHDAHESHMPVSLSTSAPHPLMGGARTQQHRQFHSCITYASSYCMLTCSLRQCDLARIAPMNQCRRDVCSVGAHRALQTRVKGTFYRNTLFKSSGNGKSRRWTLKSTVRALLGFVTRVSTLIYRCCL